MSMKSIKMRFNRDLFWKSERDAKQMPRNKIDKASIESDKRG